MNPRSHYILKHTTQQVKAYVSEIQYKIDVNTLHRQDADQFTLNEIGRVTIKTARPIFFDNYRVNRGTGSFILIDPLTNHTVAAGMIRGRSRDIKGATQSKHAEAQRSTNVRWEGGLVSAEDWERRNGHKGAVLWCTGFSGAGKSTVAKGLVKSLFAKGCQVMMLDGDNVRHGLCGDLGFSDQDRSENIRRVGETARLFYEQGNIVICTFISPFREDHNFVRSILPDGAFSEVFIKCELEVCKRRDPKGLYRKAEAGEIKDMTGIDSPYEEPDQPEITVETDIHSVESIVEQLEEYLRKSKII